jgi:hypothetical protein
MCRNIKILFNFDPPATDEEIRNASLQYVRKLSGFVKPSKVNEQAFENTVTEIAAQTKFLLTTLVTTASKKNREEEARLAQERSKRRFGSSN